MLERPRSRTHRFRDAAIASFAVLVVPGVPAVACSSVSACLFENNAGSGPGLTGESARGNGIVGITTYASPDASHEHSGLAGQDLSNSTYSFGVFGFSTVGTGTRGKSTSGIGVFGTSQSGSGVSGSSTIGTGVVGTGNTGVSGTSAKGGVGVFGSGHYGVFATGDVGVIIEGGAGGSILSLDSGNRYNIGAYTTGNGADGVYSQIGPQTGGSAFHAYVASNASDPPALFTGTSDLGQNIVDVATIDATGNMFLQGSLTTRGSPLVSTRASSGRDVTSFGMRASSPSIEDTGEGRLVNGHAYVSFDPAFAAVVDSHVPYFVFTTPHADSKGLYVEQMSPTGFAVRENGNGRSTLAFDYRIVAKPYDSPASRLPSTLHTFQHRALPPRPEMPKIGTPSSTIR